MASRIGDLFRRRRAPSTEPPGCAHDDRLEAPRMGAPFAWICRRCGERGGE